eukprot:180717_1
MDLNKEHFASSIQWSFYIFINLIDNLVKKNYYHGSNNGNNQINFIYNHIAQWKLLERVLLLIMVYQIKYLHRWQYNRYRSYCLWSCYKRKGDRSYCLWMKRTVVLWLYGIGYVGGLCSGLWLSGDDSCYGYTSTYGI